MYTQPLLIATCPCFAKLRRNGWWSPLKHSHEQPSNCGLLRKYKNPLLISLWFHCFCETLPWSPRYGVVDFISFIIDCFSFSFWMRCVLKGRGTYKNLHLFHHLSQWPRCFDINFEDNALHNHNLC